MTRSFEPSDLIALPVLDANEACVLARSLEGATNDDQGNPRELPDMVKDALEDVKEARAALWEALGGTAAGLDLGEIDRKVDNTAKALRYICLGWSFLKGQMEQGDVGAELTERLFIDGLAWLNIKPRSQWGVVETKLQTIDREKLEPKLDKLGAGPALAHLRALQGPYGKASGATEPLPAETAPIQEKRLALLDAMRHFVAAVVGIVSRKRPETKALADTLLKPLVEWETTAARKKQKPADDTGGGQGSGGSGSGGTGGDGSGG
jgi:hypothetical protein